MAAAREALRVRVIAPSSVDASPRRGGPPPSVVTCRSPNNGVNGKIKFAHLVTIMRIVNHVATSEVASCEVFAKVNLGEEKRAH